MAEGILSIKALSVDCCGGSAETSVVAERMDVRVNTSFIVIYEISSSMQFAFGLDSSQ